MGLCVANHYSYDYYEFGCFLAVGTKENLLLRYTVGKFDELVTDEESHSTLAQKGKSHIFIELVPEEDVLL